MKFELQEKSLIVKQRKKLGERKTMPMEMRDDVCECVCIIEFDSGIK